MPKSMKIGTAAEEYDVDERQLRKKCLSGEVKAKKFGRLWYIPVAELNKIFGTTGGNHGGSKSGRVEGS